MLSYLQKIVALALYYCTYKIDSEKLISLWKTMFWTWFSLNTHSNTNVPLRPVCDCMYHMWTYKGPNSGFSLVQGTFMNDTFHNTHTAAMLRCKISPKCCRFVICGIWWASFLVWCKKLKGYPVCCKILKSLNLHCQYICLPTLCNWPDFLCDVM